MTNIEEIDISIDKEYKDNKIKMLSNEFKSAITKEFGKISGELWIKIHKGGIRAAKLSLDIK